MGLGGRRIALQNAWTERHAVAAAACLGVWVTQSTVCVPLTRVPGGGGSTAV